LGNCGVAGASPEESVNLLAGSLYGALKSNAGNVFFSPFSVLTAMSMAQEGANGDTACQMQTVLDLDPSASTRLPAFQTFLNTLNAPSQPYTLLTSDNLWVQQGFSLAPSYVNDMTTYYKSGVNHVDFINDSTGAVNTIDGAVSQQTAGYIPKLLSPGDLNPLTRLVLTNAVYFKGDWEMQFETTNTNSQSFYLEGGSSEPVSMMHLSLNAPIGDFNGMAKVLALPYKGSGASMFIFLPPTGGTATLEAAMTGSNLQSWLASNRASLTSPGGFSVDLALPKFTFSTQYALGSTFPALGMTLAFQPPTPPNIGADFSGIDGMRDLYIQKVIHQAYVGVDEKGTTAAAGTGVGIGTMNAVIISQAFTVDHPFVFLIVDNGTGTILFMGRVSDPTVSN
jgi:serpin B